MNLSRRKMIQAIGSAIIAGRTPGFVVGLVSGPTDTFANVISNYAKIWDDYAKQYTGMMRNINNKYLLHGEVIIQLPLDMKIRTDILDTCS